MSGIEVWDSRGVKTLDTDDRLMRILGQRAISGTGSLHHAGLSSGEPFYFLVPQDDGVYVNGESVISFSGDWLTWDIAANFYSSSTRSVLIIFGVF